MRNVLPENLDDALQYAELGAILNELESAKITLLTEWTETLPADQLRRVHDHYKCETKRNVEAEFEAVRLTAMTYIVRGNQNYCVVFPEYAHLDMSGDDTSKKGAE